jgi:hypothetical protein
MGPCGDGALAGKIPIRNSTHRTKSLSTQRFDFLLLEVSADCRLTG